MKIEPDLRLRKNLGEVNYKEGCEEKNAENVSLPSCISYLTITNKKHTKKQPALFVW